MGLSHSSSVQPFLSMAQHQWVPDIHSSCPRRRASRLFFWIPVLQGRRMTTRDYGHVMRRSFARHGRRRGDTVPQATAAGHPRVARVGRRQAHRPRPPAPVPRAALWWAHGFNLTAASLVVGAEHCSMPGKIAESFGCPHAFGFLNQAVVPSGRSLPDVERPFQRINSVGGLFQRGCVELPTGGGSEKLCQPLPEGVFPHQRHRTDPAVDPPFAAPQRIGKSCCSFGKDECLYRVLSDLSGEHACFHESKNTSPGALSPPSSFFRAGDRHPSWRLHEPG